MEFLQDLLAGIQSPPAPPEGIFAKVTPHSITLTWPVKKEVSVYVVEIKVGSEWCKVYEGVEEAVLVEKLAPNTSYDFRVAASNSSGSSPHTYFEATTGKVEQKYATPTNYGTVLRDSVGGSEMDLGEIDELESEIFGKIAHGEEKFEAGPAEEVGKDPFFDVFLTSEEYRRVVAAAHDQLHRRKILAVVDKK